MKSTSRIEWTEAGRASLEALLSRANGRRTTRVMTLSDVEACAAQALDSELGLSWRNAGEGVDARAVTTVCLCVVRDASITIGIAAAHGAANPSSGFSDLPAWDRYHEPANMPACVAWAGRRRDDRVSVPLLRERQGGATREELLAQVLAAPDDDGPRLVYADFLSEQGDPRGEFIQVQCALAHHPREDLVARSNELLEEHGAQWVPRGPVRVEFERGFAERVTVLDAQALTDFPAFFEAEPVQSLRVSSSRLIDAARFGMLAWLERLSTLEFERTGGVPALNREQLGFLLGSRRLRRLSRLRFSGQRLGDEGARALLEQGPATFPSLTSLALERDSVTQRATVIAAASRWFGALTELSLDDNALGAEGVVPLAEVKGGGRLLALSVSGNQLGNDGAFVIARAARFVSLRRLGLARNRIGVAGLEALLGSETLRGLESLDLESNPVGASGRERLRARFGQSRR